MASGRAVATPVAPAPVVRISAPRRAPAAAPGRPRALGVTVPLVAVSLAAVARCGRRRLWRASSAASRSRRRRTQRAAVAEESPVKEDERLSPDDVEVGTRVKYWSERLRMFISATVTAKREDGSIDLNCKRQAKIEWMKASPATERIKLQETFGRVGAQEDRSTTGWGPKRYYGEVAGNQGQLWDDDKAMKEELMRSRRGYEHLLTPGQVEEAEKEGPERKKYEIAGDLRFTKEPREVHRGAPGLLPMHEANNMLIHEAEEGKEVGDSDVEEYDEEDEEYDEYDEYDEDEEEGFESDDMSLVSQEEEDVSLMTPEDKVAKLMKFNDWDPNFEDTSPPLPGSIEVAKKMAMDKVLPEEKELARVFEEENERREAFEEQFENYKSKARLPEENFEWLFGDLADLVVEEAWEEDYDEANALVVEKELEDEERLNTGWYAMSEATQEEKEAVARASVTSAHDQAKKRQIEKKEKWRVGQPIGTGEPIPDGYVEIGPRPEAWEPGGVEEESLNVIIHKNLGVSLKQANRIIALGSVWVWEEDHEEGKRWERIKDHENLEPHKVLRVFPNPERFNTCYLHDWRDRVKKVDQDFVVVDKPPLMPCFAKVSNGREHLGMCLREALRVRQWRGLNNPITEDLVPCYHIDEEVSGLVVLSRHITAEGAFHDWVRANDVIFEYVALVTGSLKIGKYRHFYEKAENMNPTEDCALYDEVPVAAQQAGRWNDWDFTEMEVVAVAPLPGGHSALRIRSKNEYPKQRIRSQLAMLGCPCLNDQAVKRQVAWNQANPDESLAAIPQKSSSASSSSSGGSAGQDEAEEVDSAIVLQEEVDATLSQMGFSGGPAGAAAKLGPLGGGVSDEVLRGPYGHKLQLLPRAQKAADQGKSQRPRKKVPVALHLARVQFKGRTVTCAPPPYWPEGAAAAVAVKLTEGDLLTNIRAYLVTNGGSLRFSKIGGTFGVRKDWLMENFPCDVAKGRVFASEDAKANYEEHVRRTQGDKAWKASRVKRRRPQSGDRKMRIGEAYRSPYDRLGRGAKPLPRFKQIRKNKVQPAPGYEGRGMLVSDLGGYDGGFFRGKHGNRPMGRDGIR